MSNSWIANKICLWRTCFIMLFLCRTHQKQKIQNKIYLILISVYHFKCSCWKKYLAKISVEGALHNTINYHTKLKCSAFLSRHFYQDKTRPGLTDIEGSNKTRTLTPRLGVEKNKHFFVFIQLMSKRDMFHNPQIRYVGQWQGDILCDWKHTPLILTKATKGELGYDFEPS